MFDYLVKPVQPERLAQTVASASLKNAFGWNSPPSPPRPCSSNWPNAFSPPPAPRPGPAAALDPRRRRQLGAPHPGGRHRLLEVRRKYTSSPGAGDAGRPAEALIRTSLKALLEQLDPAQFQQVHRAVVVNPNAVSHVTPGLKTKRPTCTKHRPEVLPVSRTYLHLFKAE